MAKVVVTKPPGERKRKLTESVELEKVVITKRKNMRTDDDEAPEERRSIPSSQDDEGPGGRRGDEDSMLCTPSMPQDSRDGDKYDDEYSEQLCLGGMKSIHLSSQMLSDEGVKRIEEDILRCEDWVDKVTGRLVALRCIDDVLSMVSDVARVTQDDVPGVCGIQGEESNVVKDEADQGDDRVVPDVRSPVSDKLREVVAGVKTGTELVSDHQDTSNVRRAQSMFGGAVATKKVRQSNTPNKKCVRSKLNRCLVHRCPFVEEERSKRVLKKDENGKVGFCVVSETVWRCSSVKDDGCSLPRPIPSSGGHDGGRIDAQNTGKHMDRKLSSAQLPYSRT